jgi:hypothetical protein
MPIAFVANTALRSTDNNNVTTPAMNTTGANFLVVVVADDQAVPMTLTDSKANTWTGLTSRVENFCQVQIFYATNPTVGSGHTFTATSTVAYPALAVLAFSGVATTSPFDVETGNTAFAFTTFLACGPLTPTAANEVLVGGINQSASSVTSISASAPFTTVDALPSTPAAYGVASAYEIQTTATTRDLTWSWTGNSSSAVVAIAAFKALAGPATKAPPPGRPRWRIIRRAA